MCYLYRRTRLPHIVQPAWRRCTDLVFVAFAFYSLRANRSVHIGVEPVRNVCVELRGYKIGEGPEEKCTLRDGGTKTPSMAECSSSSWWDRNEAPPKFLQMQRTDDPSGSFAFVTPESGMILSLAVYSHGGDYPTAVRFLQHHTGDASTAAAEQHRWHVSPGVESGKLEVRINLAEGTDMPELLSWSATARENDNSPCALDRMVDFEDGPAIWGGTRVVPLSTSSSALQFVPSWLKHDLVGGNRPANSGINLLLIAREGFDDRETATGLQQLAALMRPSCLNYGQQRAGLWEANAAVCAIFNSALQPEPAHESILQKLIVSVGQMNYNVGTRGILEAAIAFGSILVSLCVFLSCIFRVSSTSEDEYVCIRSTGGSSQDITNTVVGAFDSSTGGMSHLAIAAPSHLAESNVVNKNRRSNAWGRPKRVVPNTTEGTDDYDAFSSMFSTLDDTYRRGVGTKGESDGPPQSWICDHYVVFEQ